LKGYYFITDSGLSRNGSEYDIRCAIKENVRVIQYREKEASTGRMFQEAREYGRICRESGKAVAFIVNDRLDIALASDADGVHIGQDDMPCAVARKLLGPGKIIGVTVHSVEEALRAAVEGADYVATSPVFPTETKKDAGRASGTGLVSDIKKNTSLPVVAIGGIKYENARAVIQAGADMICAISAVVADGDPCLAIRRFQEMYL